MASVVLFLFSTLRGAVYSVHFTADHKSQGERSGPTRFHLVYRKDPYYQYFIKATHGTAHPSLGQYGTTVYGKSPAPVIEIKQLTEQELVRAAARAPRTAPPPGVPVSRKPPPPPSIPLRCSGPGGRHVGGRAAPPRCRRHHAI